MAETQINLREIQIIGKATHERIVHPAQCAPLRRHCIRLAGLSRAQGEFVFTRLRPDMLQILVSLSGEGRVWSEGRWQPVRPGQAYVTPAHTPHAYRAQGRWETGWCMFEPDAFPEFQGGPVIREVNPAPWLHILSGLCDENATSADPVQLEGWTALLQREGARLVAGERPQRLWRLWSRVRDDLAAPWTLASLAQAAGLSPEMMRLECRRELKLSPVAYLTHLRMRHATALLATGRKVEAVARQVGYENAFAFSTAFRRVTGFRPSTVNKAAVRKN